MTAEIRQLIRLSILQMLEAAPVNGLALSMLSTGLQARGLREVGTEEIRKELAYLADKGFVRQREQDISPELSPWRITADGRDQIA